jgi:hypothetical protein
MPRRREYATNAERQAAYRARHAHQQPPRQELLAALARSLHGAWEEAVRSGHSRLPAHLLHPRADQTLQNLIRYLRGDLAPTAEPEAEAPPTQPPNPDASPDAGKNQTLPW